MLLQGATLEELQMQKQHVQDLLNQNIRQAVWCIGYMSDASKHCRHKPCCHLRPQPLKCRLHRVNFFMPLQPAADVSAKPTPPFMPTEVKAACLPKHPVVV